MTILYVLSFHGHISASVHEIYQKDVILRATPYAYIKFVTTIFFFPGQSSPEYNFFFSLLGYISADAYKIWYKSIAPHPT